MIFLCLCIFCVNAQNLSFLNYLNVCEETKPNWTVDTQTDVTWGIHGIQGRQGLYHLLHQKNTKGGGFSGMLYSVDCKERDFIWYKKNNEETEYYKEQDIPIYQDYTREENCPIKG